jgi:poly [ADP-ribose] polymerase
MAKPTTPQMTDKALIDKSCRYKDCAIVNQNGLLYTCTLNQTDLKTNKNKFYIVQLIKVSDIQYCVFIRYGRIGEIGKISHTLFTDLNTGISTFKKAFRDKTKNYWSPDIYKTFKQYNGKYFLTTIDIESINIPKTDMVYPDSKLDVRVQNLLRILTNKEMMDKSLINLEIDTKKMPLGKLSKQQIDMAYEVLKDINTKLTNYDEVVNLSSKFYTLIPYSTRRRTPPVIDNPDIINKYLNLLDELSHIVITAKIIKDNTLDTTLNPLDKSYSDLNAKITPLSKEGEMWKVITNYMKIAPTHTEYNNYELIDIFRLSRNSEKENFDTFCKDIQNHKLLWHGSGLSNWCSIIKNGFRLPNTLKGVVFTGCMFGSGIYFSNMFSKSIGYTRYHQFDNYACLCLTEVALGKQYERLQAEYDIDKEKLTTLGYTSTYGRGETSVNKRYKINDNIYVPAGDMYKTNLNSSLLYDEFIVYDTNKVRQCYLVLIKLKR